MFSKVIILRRLRKDGLENDEKRIETYVLSFLCIHKGFNKNFEYKFHADIDGLKETFIFAGWEVSLKILIDKKAFESV